MDAFLYEAKLYVTEKKWSVVQVEINFDGNADDPFASADATNDVPMEETVPA